MRIICLILARGGSLRLKNKNKRKIIGKSLIEHTIQFAEKSHIYNKIYLSTDDTSLINIYKNRILVPWKRPKKYAAAKSTSEDTILHFLRWYKKKFPKFNSCLMLLQPTSPFRNMISFKKAIKIFKERKYKGSIVGVSPNKFNYKNSNIISIKKKFFFVNGSLYLSTINEFMQKKSFFNSNTNFYIQNHIQESIDIDTSKDLFRARKLAKLNIFS